MKEFCVNYTECFFFFFPSVYCTSRHQFKLESELYLSCCRELRHLFISCISILALDLVKKNFRALNEITVTRLDLSVTVRWLPHCLLLWCVHFEAKNIYGYGNFQKCTDLITIFVSVPIVFLCLRFPARKRLVFLNLCLRAWVFGTFLCTWAWRLQATRTFSDIVTGSGPFPESGCRHVQSIVLTRSPSSIAQQPFHWH